MNKMKTIKIVNKLIFAFALMTSVHHFNGQQTSLFSHYFLQEHIVNPALTGNRTYNPIYISYRNQWTGFNGSPETIALSGHYALDRKNGIGGIIFNDVQGGSYTQTGGQLNYAHHIQLKDKGFFSLGFGALFDQFRGDYSSLLAIDPNDPAVQIANESKLVTDISAGFNLNVSGFRIGVSGANLLESGISDNGLYPDDNRLKRQVNLLASYRANFDSSFVLEPILQVKTIGATPIQVDATVLGHIKELVSVGVSYRSNAALTGILGINIKGFLLSYSYDMATTSAQPFLGNTHEVVLGYRPKGKGGKASGDKDLDGVLDADDKCPIEFGPKENDGCPYADADKDGVPDNIDKCPYLRGNPQLAGCPDRDGDGIADLKDECPDLSGPADNNGCPRLAKLYIYDSQGREVTVVNEDGNGAFVINGLSHEKNYYYLIEAGEKSVPNPINITIINDKGEHQIQASKSSSGYYESVAQPTVNYVYKIQLMASPNSIDLNSADFKALKLAVQEYLDEQSNSPFKYKYRVGSFDSREEASTALTEIKKGKFKDAYIVKTEVDKAKEEAPLPEEKPVEKIEIQEVALEVEDKLVVNEAFDNLEFETGKSIIKEASYKSLLELVKLLDANSSWRLLLTGHTDNVGDAMFNLLLSKKRAEAVRYFLNQFGIDQQRIIVNFEGENQPIESNETEEGRSKNRRVEMVVIH